MLTATAMGFFEAEIAKAVVLALWGNPGWFTAPVRPATAQLRSSDVVRAFRGTLVDVTGLVIYFLVATALLRGTLL